LLRSQLHPNPRGDDHERITRARQAAEALFASRPPVSKPSGPETASVDLPQRKPRVLRIIAPAAIRLEDVKTSVSSPDLQAKPAIPRSHFPRIRARFHFVAILCPLRRVWLQAMQFVVLEV
jgi:hypothetical protein